MWDASRWMVDERVNNALHEAEHERAYRRMKGVGKTRSSLKSLVRMIASLLGLE
jgi:hypothetical protein